MKTFNATQLSQKPADVFAAAREGGAIIQQKRTNGEVIEEFILLPNNHEAIWQLYQESEKGEIRTLGQVMADNASKIWPTDREK